LQGISRSARHYVLAVYLLALATLALWRLVIAPVAVGRSDAFVLALFGLAMVIAEVRPVSVRRSLRGDQAGAAQSFTVGLHVATVIVFGPVLAALVATTAAALGEIGRRSLWYKALFNTSVVLLSVFWSGTLFWNMGGSVLVRFPRDYFGAITLVVVYFVINSLLIAPLLAFVNHTRLGDAVRLELRETTFVFAAEGSLGILVAFVYQVSAWALPFLALPMAAVAMAHQNYVKGRVETEEALIAMADVVESRDESTAQHSLRVAEYAVSLGRSLGLRETELHSLELAGRLHDLGKIGIDNSILFKPGLLTPEEYQRMQAHPELSGKILEWFEFAREEAQYIHLHHERLDGRGYPYGLMGSEIPIAARILSIADAFDAMTTNRPYRPSMTRKQAIETLRANAGTQFDPNLVETFISIQTEGEPPARSGPLPTLATSGE